MHYNTSNKNNTHNHNYQDNLELKLKENFKIILKELLVLAIFYYFIFTFSFIVIYKIFFAFFIKQEKTIVDINSNLNNFKLSNFLAIFNINSDFNNFSFSFFNNNFMILSFIYNGNSKIDLILTKRDIYSYELLSKKYSLKFDNYYKVNYSKLNINDLAILDLFISTYNEISQKNSIFYLNFDSNLSFLKSFEFYFNIDNFNNFNNYYLKKVDYYNKFYYILFTLFNKENDLKENNKIILAKIDSTTKEIKDLKLIKLPYNISSIDLYYPFIFITSSYNEESKFLLLKVQDKKYIEILPFFLESNYSKIELLDVINLKDNYYLIFKTYKDLISNEIIFLNLNDKNEVENVYVLKSEFINLINIKKSFIIDKNLYLIYQLINDNKCIGIIKLNMMDSSFFNKVIFTNKDVKFLDLKNIFKNLIMFWGYLNSDISILSLDLSNDNKINNNIDPVFIIDYNYYQSNYKNNNLNKAEFNFTKLNSFNNVGLKLVPQRDFLICINVSKNYFYLKPVDKLIIDLSDIKISNKEVNFF